MEEYRREIAKLFAQIMGEGACQYMGEYTYYIYIEMYIQIYNAMCHMDTWEKFYQQQNLSFLGAAAGSPYIVFISTSGM